MRAGLLIASLVLVATPARAQVVTFDDALALGQDAPDVRGLSRALHARATGDRGISDLTSATELQLVPGVRVLQEQERGFEGSIGIAQGWNLAGLGAARRGAASSERARLAAAQRAAALTRRLAAARAWIDLAVLERQLALARQETELARRTLARIERAMEGGVLTAADVSEARAFVGETDLRALAAEGERTTAMLALAAAMGSDVAGEMRTGGPPPVPRVPDGAELRARLSDVDDLPEVEAARLAAAAQRAREVEIDAAGGPTMTTGVQVYRESPSSMIVFGQLSFGIPLVDLVARDRSVALAEAEELEAQHEERVLQARRDAVAIAREVDRARREEEILAGEVVPALEQLVSQRARQLRAGETTVLAALDAERRRIVARARLEQATGARLWAEVRAWLLLATRATAREEGP